MNPNLVSATIPAEDLQAINAASHPDALAETSVPDRPDKRCAAIPRRDSAPTFP